MDNLYIEAYKFYKEECANSLVLFHNQSCFEAYEEDAIRLSNSLNLPVSYRAGIKYCAFPESALESSLPLLVHIGIPVKIVEYRNEKGEFLIPKVKHILEDEIMDY